MKRERIKKLFMWNVLNVESFYFCRTYLLFFRIKTINSIQNINLLTFFSVLRLLLLRINRKFAATYRIKFGYGKANKTRRRGYVASMAT